MKIILLLLLAFTLASCASNCEDGPDTARKVDKDGNPNFGPK